MRIGTSLLVAGILLSSSVSAQAGSTIWNNWSSTDYIPDAASDVDATLSIDNTGSMYGGPYGGFFYTGAAAANLSITSALVGNVSEITLAITQAGSFTGLPTLTIGGQGYSFDAMTIVDDGEVEGFATKLYSFGWDLGSFADGTDFVITWTLPAHVAFTQITMTQVSGATAAVPEPAACAMMLVGLAGVGALAKRRRRAA